MSRKKYDQEGSTSAPGDLGAQVAELFLRYMVKHGDVEDHRAATHMLGRMGKLQPCKQDEEKRAHDEQALAEQAKIDEAAADSDDCLVDLKNDEVVLNKEEENEYSQ